MSTQSEECLVVKSPADIANLLQGEMSFVEQEEMRVVLLNTKNQILSIPRVHKGSINTSLVIVSELFKEAMQENCAALETVWMQLPHYP